MNIFHTCLLNLEVISCWCNVSLRRKGSRRLARGKSGISKTCSHICSAYNDYNYGKHPTNPDDGVHHSYNEPLLCSVSSFLLQQHAGSSDPASTMFLAVSTLCLLFVVMHYFCSWNSIKGGHVICLSFEFKKKINKKNVPSHFTNSERRTVSEIKQAQKQPHRYCSPHCAFN